MGYRSLTRTVFTASCTDSINNCTGLSRIHWRAIVQDVQRGIFTAVWAVPWQPTRPVWPSTRIHKQVAFGKMFPSGFASLSLPIPVSLFCPGFRTCLVCCSDCVLAFAYVCLSSPLSACLSVFVCCVRAFTHVLKKENSWTQVKQCKRKAKTQLQDIIIENGFWWFVC